MGHFYSIIDPQSGSLLPYRNHGAKRDVQITNDGDNTNPNWDAVWSVRTHRNEEGWTTELVIPLKTLRFPADFARPWGINFSRRNRWKNEVSVWNFIPRRYSLTRVSLAGSLSGLEQVQPGRNLKLTPYGLFEYSRTAGQDDTELKGGTDLKYGLTTTLTLDLTLNTDFSEVEVDEQRVNLTRFPLFFSEKRIFFLESADIFHFGVRPTEKGGGPNAEEFIGFFSRRIGLSSEGDPLPIWGGARLTGRSGPYSLGLLQFFTREEEPFPSTAYTVLRLKKDILRQSDVGVLLMNRSAEPGDYTRMIGSDLNFEFLDRLSLTSFLAKSFTPGVEESDYSGKVFAGWSDNLLQVFSTYIDIGENVDDSMSFVPRKGVRLVRSSFYLRPRPKIPWVREFAPHVSHRYIMNRDFDLRTERTHIGLWTYFHNGSRFEIFQNQEFQVLDNPFRIHPGVLLPVGNYSFNNMVVQYFHNPSSSLFGNIRYSWGDFWSGSIRGLNYGVTVRVRPRFFVQVGHQKNWVKLP